MRCFSKEEIAINSLLNLCWEVMNENDRDSELYKTAEGFWIQFADESVVANRPVKLIIRDTKIYK